jgi:hypothetical protein
MRTAMLCMADTCVHQAQTNPGSQPKGADFGRRHQTIQQWLVISTSTSTIVTITISLHADGLHGQPCPPAGGGGEQGH